MSRTCLCQCGLIGTNASEPVQHRGNQLLKQLTSTELSLTNAIARCPEAKIAAIKKKSDEDSVREPTDRH